MDTHSAVGVGREFNVVGIIYLSLQLFKCGKRRKTSDKCLDCFTNSLHRHRRKCMENGVENIHYSKQSEPLIVLRGQSIPWWLDIKFLKVASCIIFPNYPHTWCSFSKEMTSKFREGTQASTWILFHTFAFSSLGSSFPLGTPFKMTYGTPKLGDQQGQ